MSFTNATILNVVLAIGVVAALAYVCRLPFQFDRFVPTAAPATQGEAGEGHEREQLAA